MSPTSYQTAPPRTSILTVPGKHGQICAVAFNVHNHCSAGWIFRNNKKGPAFRPALSLVIRFFLEHDLTHQHHAAVRTTILEVGSEGATGGQIRAVDVEPRGTEELTVEHVEHISTHLQIETFGQS